MHHVAIMNKAWKLIPKVLSGEKTVESRWYQTRRVPWGAIHAGDTVYFKNSGEPVTAEATVSKVLQYTLKNMVDAQNIVTQFGKQIQIVNPNLKTWATIPKYCILVFLKNPRPVAKPWRVDKSGFGSATAWLTVKNIDVLKNV